MTQLHCLTMPLLDRDARIGSVRGSISLSRDDSRGVNCVENGRYNVTQEAVSLSVAENGCNQERERRSDGFCDMGTLGDADSCDMFGRDGALRRADSRSSPQPRNAYSFLGQPPSLGAMPPIDPFRNHTEQIVGVYEWIKILICLPLALVRIILALLLTLIGYLL
eukprot:c56124_g1_i1 orf=1-492(-)